MTRFDFNFLVDTNGGLQKQELHYNWTLLFKRTLLTKKIGIEREDSDREDRITGKLQIKFISLVLIGEKDFDDVFHVGQTFLNLALVTNDFPTNLIITGYMIIQENSDKQGYDLQNGQDKQAKSLERENKKKLLEKLSSDFEGLLDSKTPSFSDVTLKCGDATIPAHKNILSSRSPVFAAMFANPMKESIKNEVDISDIDMNTVQALLRYMYTGKIDFTISSTTELLLAADKYQLQELKNSCSDFLKDTVSMQNVLRILVLGDMIDSDLKSFAVDYICNKCADFSALENTEEWETLQKERPALSIEILTSMVKSMNEKFKK